MDCLAERAREIESDYQRVAYYLAIWKIWMLGSDLNLGYPSKCIAIEGSGKRSFEDFCDATDKHAAETIDAIIGDFPPHHQMAIHHFNLGGAVWRMARLDIGEVYAEALAMLQDAMRKRGLQ